MRALAITVVLALTASSPADSSVRLTPSAERSDVVRPYSPAELTVTNTSEKVVEEIRIRWKQGGPTLVHRVEIAPRQRATVETFLPAVWPEQTCKLAMIGHDGRELTTSEATISWPDELLHGDAFLDPRTWRLWDPATPVWSTLTRANAFIAVFLVSVAACGALLIRRPALRAAAITAVVVAGSVTTTVLLPEAVEVWTPSMEDGRWQREASNSHLLAVAARRTTTAKLSEGHPAPVYLSRREMAEDRMLLHADGRVEIPLESGQVRLFQRSPG
ncbi:MAG: hypothetical protein ACOC9S_00185 [Planctomycetota bacterium]